MELHYLVAYIASYVFSKINTTFNKTFFVISITCIFAGVSQSAPTRRERWNPYYYPTARSLSIPPTTKTTTTSTTATTTLVTLRHAQPRKRLVPNFSADRRASHSLNSTRLKTSTKPPASGKDQIKFELGNVTAIRHALNDFIEAAEVLVRELLISTNTGLLKVVGQVDQGIVKFQQRLQSTGLRLAFAGQRAAAQTYEALPPFVNQLIQRLGTPSDGRSRDQLTVQLNDAIKNLRQLKQMLLDAMDEHEKDFHNVFEDRFDQINQYLGVPGLPRKPLAWYS